MVDLMLLLPTMFAIAGLTCLVLAFQTKSISDECVRNGLKYTLIFSGLWSLTELSKFIVLNEQIATAVHIIGLFFGLITVYSWFQFASAFSGRSYHQKPVVKKVSIITLASIIFIKITNPIHGSYFDLTVSEEPIPHVSIDTLLLNDVITILAYSVSLFGVYLVYLGLKDRDQSLINILSLITFIGVPSLISIAIRTEVILPYLSGISLDPIGVAVFSCATLLVMNSVYADFYRESRQDFINSIDDPVLIADNKGLAINSNSAFDSISEKNIEEDDKVEDLVNDFDAFNEIKDETMINVGEKHYLVNLVTFSESRSEDSVAIIMKDKTEEVKSERIMQRQDEQFEYLAEGMAHEIRNIIQVIRGHSDILSNEDLSDSQHKSVNAISNVSERLNRVSEDLNVLAMTGKSSFQTSDYNLSDLLRDPKSDSSISVSVEGDGKVTAHERRFELMAKKLIQFVESTNGTEVVFDLQDDELVVTGDCDSLSDVSIDKAFSYGEAVPSADVGSILPAARAVIDSHQWNPGVNKEYDGLQVKIRGIKPESED